MSHHSTGTTRRYHSARRQAQAEETRRAILAAANRLFLERGYLATTVDAVAHEAGVAKETVYANFGRKQDILLALLHTAVAGEGDAEPFTERPDIKPILQETDGRRQVALFARSIRGVMERGNQLFRTLVEASHKEPEIAALVREMQDDRHAKTMIVVAAIAAGGPLRSGRSVREATDATWALTSPEVFRLLSNQGWTLDAYEVWLAESLGDLLLPSTPCASNSPAS
jgi:AcrR family transcriptional regulator